jgi:hypothetical protein
MKTKSPTALRVHKVASVVYRLGFEKEIEVTTSLEPRAGNTIVVRALSEKRVYSELELENGRMSKIFRGDVLVGALGRRRALRGFSGDVPARLKVGDTVQLLNRGGVIGGSASAHMALGAPVSCEVLGMPVREGAIVKLADATLPRVESLAGGALPPVVVVSGSCMESGKTLFLSEATQELSKAGLTIAGGKLTGIACLRDLIALEDHGAAVTASFLDAGHSSTAGLGREALVTSAKTVIAHLASSHPDLILLEMGDGVIGDYGVLDILEDPEIDARITMHAFCAGDLVGAWGGRELLARHEIEIDLYSGPATDNAVGVEYIEKQFKKPAINAHRNPEELAAAILKHLQMEGRRP